MTRPRLALNAILIAAALLWTCAWLARERLSTASADLAISHALSTESAALPARKGALPPATAGLPGPADRATATLISRLAGHARAARVMTEILAPAPPPAPGLAAATLVISGREDRVRATIDMVERGTPLVRFTDWRLERAAGPGAVRLTTRAIAAWH